MAVTGGSGGGGGGFDISSVLGSVVQAGVQYFTASQQMKQAKKLAKIQASGGSQFPMLGTGNMQFQGVGMGYSIPLGFNQSPIDRAISTYIEDPINQAVNYLTGEGGQPMQGVTAGSSSTACPSLFVAQMGPNQLRARAMSHIVAQNPSTGKLHCWRHVGTPILYSGDVSHAKRVTKLLGKQSRKLGRGRPR